MVRVSFFLDLPLDLEFDLLPDEEAAAGEALPLPLPILEGGGRSCSESEEKWRLPCQW